MLRRLPDSAAFDAIDTAIIRLLYRNARLPYTAIAAKVGINQVTTKRRISRMLDAGSIRMELIPNPALLGFNVAAVIAIQIKLGSMERIAQRLVAIPNAAWVTQTFGRYDFMVFAFFRSSLDLAKFVENELSLIEGIERADTLVNLKVVRSWWTNILESGQVSRELDTLDRSIIESLRANIRASLADLADKLGTSIPTVRERVNRFTKEGILGFCALPDLAKLGYEIITTIGLSVRLSRIKDVERILSTNGRLEYITLASGQFDLILLGLFRSADDLSDFVKNDLAPIEGIERSETFISYGVLKESYEGVIDTFLGQSRS